MRCERHYHTVHYRWAPKKQQIPQKERVVTHGTLAGPQNETDLGMVHGWEKEVIYLSTSFSFPKGSQLASYTFGLHYLVPLVLFQEARNHTSWCVALSLSKEKADWRGGHHQIRVTQEMVENAWFLSLFKMYYINGYLVWWSLEPPHHSLYLLCNAFLLH